MSLEEQQGGSEVSQHKKAQSHFYPLPLPLTPPPCFEGVRGRGKGQKWDWALGPIPFLQNQAMQSLEDSEQVSLGPNSISTPYPFPLPLPLVLKG